MNIGIEATKAHHIDGGFGVYPRKLIKNMLSMDNDNLYFVFASERIEGLDEFNNCRQFLMPVSDGLVNFLRLFFTFKGIIKKYRIDILHLLSMYGIYRTPATTISTVFDLRHLSIPELKERRFGKAIYKYVLPFLLKQSHHLISISDETKDGLIRYFKIPGDKITTIHLGHEIAFDTEISGAETGLGWNLPEKYFLWVGMITKRKNLETLYDAFSTFLKAYSDFRLVIVGKFVNSKIEGEHKKILTSLKIDDKVIFTGYAPDYELIMLYKKASAFIYPSIYEGFGIPIIEAMALGVPVITTVDGGATREVAGNAALFFKKYDASGLSRKMAEIAWDEKLRNELIMKSKVRAKEFSWKKTARLTLDVYRELTSTIGRR